MSLALHYDFAKDKSLQARLGPTLTHTRSSTATYFDSSGVMQTATTNAPRFDHNPSTLASLGLLTEEARTNICLQSEDFSTTWVNTALTITTNTDVAPDGTTTADTLNDASAGFGSVIQTFTSIPANSTYSLSIRVKKDSVPKTTRHSLLRLNRSVGTLNADHDLAFDTSTGEIVASVNAGGGSVSGSMEDLGSYWKFTLVSTDTGSNVQAQIQFYPAVGSTSGMTTYSAATTGSIVAWGMQLEAGSFPTSYVSTTTVAVSRSADRVTALGTSWLNTSEGSMFVEYDILGPASGNSILVGINDGTTNNRITSYVNSSKQVKFLVVDTTAIQVNVFIDTTTVNTTSRVACSWKVNDFRGYNDGTAATPDTLGTVPTGLTEIDIGKNGSDTQIHNGHIAKVMYHNTSLASATLDYLSQNLLKDIYSFEAPRGSMYESDPRFDDIITLSGVPTDTDKPTQWKQALGTVLGYTLTQTLTKDIGTLWKEFSTKLL